MKNHPLIYFLVLLSIFLYYPISYASTSLKQNEWDGNQYALHSKSQYEDAMNLIQGISFKGNERILDIGCGDGQFALFLAHHYPQSYVLGIDPSVSMINKAKLNILPENINFQVSKGETFLSDKKFDLIISIHAMHWIEDQPKILNNICHHLKKNGKAHLIFAPSKEGLPFDSALKKVMKKWQKDFSNFENNQYFYDIESYRKLLVSSGLQVKILSYILKEREYKDIEALGAWVKQWLPHYKLLSTEKRKLFLNDLLKAYLLEPNTTSQDKIKWDEYIIQIEAKKSF